MSTTTKADIRALAHLARLELSDEEVARLEGELPAILGFVEKIQKVSAELPKAVSPKHRNVMRDDENPHESGMYSETLLSAAPNRIGNQVAVTQVVSRDTSSHT
jgi:aspartyl-tRNA(Asn)/glutamyl-tRNA(Gln) amidotransferase subunit C